MYTVKVFLDNLRSNNDVRQTKKKIKINFTENKFMLTAIHTYIRKDSIFDPSIA